MNRPRVHPAWTTFHYAMLTLASIVVILPLWITVINSFKTPLELFRGDKAELPESFTNFANYAEFIEKQPVGLAFGNTLFVLGISLVLVTLFGTMVAYILDRYRFPGRTAIIAAYVLIVAVPPITTQVSTYQVMLWLGLVNSKWALIALYSGADIVSIYIFMQFISTISREVDESARIEGASTFTIFRRIILPLTVPAIATVVILRSIHIYNDFILPYLYTPRADQSTVSILLFKAADRLVASSQTVLMAGIVIVIAPTLILFLVLQKQIVSGVMRGSVKG